MEDRPWPLRFSLSRKVDLESQAPSNSSTSERMDRTNSGKIPTPDGPNETPAAARDATRRALNKRFLLDLAEDNQVVQQQEQMEAYEGYVFSVSTTQVTNITYVHLGGRTVINPSHGYYIFSFPPNDQKYLQELVRAMNHPHFRVFLTAKDINTDPIIIQVTVVLDYNLTPIPNYTPPFDAVEIKTG